MQRVLKAAIVLFACPCLLATAARAGSSPTALAAKVASVPRHEAAVVPMRAGSDAAAHQAQAPLNARRTLVMTATAYGPSLQDNYPYGPTDYFGAPLRVGDVAVDPSVIPLGTRLFITGYRSPYLPPGGLYATADDEGGAIRGNRIDIFLNGTPAQVSSFGVQTVRVTVLAP